MTNDSSQPARDLWCIADVWENMISSLSTEKPNWMTDTGIGAAWSKEWQKEIYARMPQREKRFSATAGMEVWHYPCESRDLFYQWLSNYTQQRNIDESIPHKSKRPILPTSNINPASRFAGKRTYFTGFYPADKETIRGVLDSVARIIVLTSFSAKTTEFLILGPNAGPTKIKVAQAHSVPCVSVEVFIDEIQV